MADVKRKATNYMDVSQFLINSKHYTESVHLSYYSSLLYMKYILHHHPKHSIPYSVQDENKENSHEFIFDEIRNRVDSPPLRRKLNEQFMFLKKERKNADYTAKLFTDVECLDIKQLSEGLQAKLREAFGKL